LRVEAPVVVGNQRADTVQIHNLLVIFHQPAPHHVKNLLNQLRLVGQHIAQVVVASQRHDIFQYAARPVYDELHPLGQIRRKTLEPPVVGRLRVRPLVGFVALRVCDDCTFVDRNARLAVFILFVREGKVARVHGGVVVPEHGIRFDFIFKYILRVAWIKLCARHICLERVV